MRSKSIDKMKQIKAFIEEYYLQYHNTPSTTEIGKAVNLCRSAAYNYLVEMNDRGMIKYSGKSIETDIICATTSERTSAAILGSVSCGLPSLEEEHIEKYVSLPTSIFGKGVFYILKANGESMIEAGIDDGDYVIIRKQSDAKEGDIIVALVENEVTLKRFFIDREKNMVRLHPENKSMSDIYVDKCIVQGVAVKVLKNLENTI